MVINFTCHFFCTKLSTEKLHWKQRSISANCGFNFASSRKEKSDETQPWISDDDRDQKQGISIGLEGWMKTTMFEI